MAETKKKKVATKKTTSTSSRSTTSAAKISVKKPAAKKKAVAKKVVASKNKASLPHKKETITKNETTKTYAVSNDNKKCEKGLFCKVVDFFKDLFS